MLWFRKPGTQLHPAYNTEDTSLISPALLSQCLFQITFLRSSWMPFYLLATCPSESFEDCPLSLVSHCCLSLSRVQSWVFFSLSFSLGDLFSVLCFCILTLCSLSSFTLTSALGALICTSQLAFSLPFQKPYGGIPCSAVIQGEGPGPAST